MNQINNFNSQNTKDIVAYFITLYITHIRSNCLPSAREQIEYNIHFAIHNDKKNFGINLKKWINDNKLILNIDDNTLLDVEDFINNNFDNL